MPQRDHDIYASAPMRGLFADEVGAMMPELCRCAGTRALLLSAAPGDSAPLLPRVGHWIQLSVAQGLIAGDIRGSASERLPFADDAFDLILLRHALEVAPAPSALLQDIVRTLAPGGSLMLTGVHPLSIWAPWWRWQTKGGGSHMHWPLQLAGWLRQADLQVEHTRRVGRALPTMSVEARDSSPLLGGGYVLYARKQRAVNLPTRLRPKPVAARVNAGLAPGARRSSAV